MMTGIHDGSRKELLLEKLVEIIEKNNEIASEQNVRLVKYTKWLFWLTIAIGSLTIVQICIGLK